MLKRSKLCIKHVNQNLLLEGCGAIPDAFQMQFQLSNISNNACMKSENNKQAAKDSGEPKDKFTVYRD